MLIIACHCITALEILKNSPQSYFDKWLLCGDNKCGAVHQLPGATGEDCGEAWSWFKNYIEAVVTPEQKDNML